MPNFTGTDSWDFFRLPLKNRHQPFDEETHPIEVATLQKKLIEGNRRPFATATSCIADTYTDGYLLDRADVNTPYELLFEPRQHFDHEKEFDADGNQVSFLDQLQRLEAGMNVYDVYALTAPICREGEFIKIAEIKLKTKPVTSKFGDTNLYFRHARPQSDYKYWPRAWNFDKDPIFENTGDNIWGDKVPEGVWPDNDEQAEKFFVDQIAEFGCPFAWLLTSDKEIKN